MKRWAIMIGAAIVGGLVARANVMLGFLIFGIGVVIAWRE